MSRNKGSQTPQRNRYIKDHTRWLLWGISAGRCEFTGCNKPLTFHPETREPLNMAEAAHIRGFSPEGPRHERDIPPELANSIENLMLVCFDCHKLIDSNVSTYTVELLKAMKRTHEQRIATATAVQENRRTHVVLYGARIGDNNSPLTWSKVAPAIAGDWYAADTTGIRLGMPGSLSTERDIDYWDQHARNLRRQVESQIKPRIDAGDIEHLSLFAVAPQPLLMLLGYLLNDLVDAEVYQLQREPAQSWRWSLDGTNDFSFQVDRPATFDGPPVLVIGTTDRIDDSRILSVLPEARIWRITINQPHNDFLKARYQLQRFREQIRPLLDEIKNRHQASLIHLFPATSIAIAIEFGRCIQPKSTPPILVYDQSTSLGGFVPTFILGSTQKEMTDGD